MFDELDRLRELEGLQRLLQRYEDLAGAEPLAWHDRVQEWDGCARRELVKLHGELLAYGWVELNTGETPNVLRTAAPASYRITPSGLRALRQLEVDAEMAR